MTLNQLKPRIVRFNQRKSKYASPEAKAIAKREQTRLAAQRYRARA